MSNLDDSNLKAEKAKSKEGLSVDSISIKAYKAKTEERAYIDDLDSLPSDEKQTMLEAGIDTTQKQRSGTFVQMDHSVIHASTLEKGLEVMSIKDALAKYDWLKDYWWKTIAVDTDKYTSQAELELHNGYFLRALPGTKEIFPVQACLYLSIDDLKQNVHNIVMVEEDAELHVITGCSVGSHVKSGLHIGVSEFYVKKNAKLSFTMIHNWAENVKVRPRSYGIVEENGMFLSNYISLKPVSDLQMYPTVKLVGKNAIARFNSILVAQKGSNLDVGSRIILDAENSKGEVISRTISKGGNIWARGHLIGKAKGITAHLECNGLILDEEGSIKAIPELEAHLPDLRMSHEAAVGKIAQDQIEYLMARGLSEDEATATIVRGFLDVDIKGLPPQLNKQIKKIIDIEGEKFL